MIKNPKQGRPGLLQHLQKPSSTVKTLRVQGRAISAGNRS